MKKTQKGPDSPIIICCCLKLNKFLYTASLFAVVLGIFLLPKTAFMATITPEKILELTNQERVKAGLNELRVNNQLASAASAKAQAVLQNQIFDHSISGQKFSSWIKASGYQYELTGENLAIDFVTSEGLMRAWLASPEHRANLMEKEYVDIGISVAAGKFAGQNTIIVVQIFGNPLIKTPLIPESISRLNEKLLPWDGKEGASQNHLSFYHEFSERLLLLNDRRIAMF